MQSRLFFVYRYALPLFQAKVHLTFGRCLPPPHSSPFLPGPARGRNVKGGMRVVVRFQSYTLYFLCVYSSEKFTVRAEKGWFSIAAQIQKGEELFCRQTVYSVYCRSRVGASKKKVRNDIFSIHLFSQSFVCGTNVLSTGFSRLCIQSLNVLLK